MQKIGRILLTAGVVVASIGVWRYIYLDSLSRSDISTDKAPPAPLAVEVVPVREQSITESIELVGSLDAGMLVEIRSRVDGYIKQIPYDVGDRIEVGADVIVLDDSSQRELISRAEASLRVADAQLKAQETELTFAERTAERQRSLMQSGAGTTSQLDAAESAVQIAAAKVELERARVAEAQSNLEQMRLELADLRLTSPVPGVVAARLVETGDLAKPDVPLLQIVNLDTVKTVVHVVERDFRKIRVGLPAVIAVDAYPGETFFGEVTRIAPMLDPETRTAAVQIDIDNDDLRLKPGMHARVSLRFNESSSRGVVPIAAVRDEGSRQAVFVVAGDPPQAVRREVRLGYSDGDMVEVLDGLNVGEEVVTLGSRLVEEGQSVTALRVPWPGDPSATPVSAPENPETKVDPTIRSSGSAL
ncbi:efflux RND transporter periplasmic adaptor subunit [Maioricimonas rarisocia]|nr:efflux RND transporter periplasmic adaptor subunit [Maioricimonas rarisocia]